MKSYKDLKQLESKAITNNGKKVFIWNDEGIKVAGKIYRQMEYGNMGYNWTGNCYVTFRNTGRKGRQLTYANRDNFSNKDSFITIEYKLNSDRINKGCLFEKEIIDPWEYNKNRNLKEIEMFNKYIPFLIKEVLK